MQWRSRYTDTPRFPTENSSLTSTLATADIGESRFTSMLLEASGMRCCEPHGCTLSVALLTGKAQVYPGGECAADQEAADH